VNYPADPVSLDIPVLPKYPCVTLDDKGNCTKVVQVGNFPSLSNSASPGLKKRLMNDVIYVDWNWKQASITVGGDAWYIKPTGGAAGAAKVTGYVLTDTGQEIALGSDNLAYLGFGAADRNGPVTFGASYVFPRAKGLIRQVGLLSPECKGYTGAVVGVGWASDTNATCDFNAAIVINFMN
jgi:hypothetical protein